MRSCKRDIVWGGKKVIQCCMAWKRGYRGR